MHTRKINCRLRAIIEKEDPYFLTGADPHLLEEFLNSDQTTDDLLDRIDIMMIGRRVEIQKQRNVIERYRERIDELSQLNLNFT